MPTSQHNHPKSPTNYTLTPADLAFLESYDFNHHAWTTLAHLLKQGKFSLANNRLTQVMAPSSQQLAWLKDVTTSSEQQADSLLAKGHVGIVILNGGMATRFGGVVKGTVPVVGTQSFLALKLRDVAHVPCPIFILNSFATLEATRQHLVTNDYFGVEPSRIHLLCQSASVRLAPTGSIFRGAQAIDTFYAPGHGDVFFALHKSQAFRDFVAGGGSHVLVSNVDNLGARLTARALGGHLQGGRSVTVELSDKAPGDAGGAPAVVNGRLQIVEGFRFPQGFPQDSIAWFNTNSMWLHHSVIHNDHPLQWYRADKTVDGQPVVQFERLMGEITASTESTFLVVPRYGAEGRFLPVKTPSDLDAVRPLVQAAFNL